MPLTTTVSWPDLVGGRKAKASEVESKFDWLEGHLWPMASGTTADLTYNLGASDKQWKGAWIGGINPTSTAAGVAIGKELAGSSTCLDMSAMPKAMLLPIVTTAQQGGLTATAGMIVYNSTNARMERYEGGQWLAMNNPIGFATKVTSTVNNVNSSTALQVTGSGRLVSVFIISGPGALLPYAEIRIDSGPAEIVVFGTNTSGYATVNSAYGSGTATGASFVSTSASSRLDIQFKSSLDIYFGVQVGGTGTQSIAILYEKS